jgi:two-component system, sensor histidine kinase LadS
MISDLLNRLLMSLLLSLSLLLPCRAEVEPAIAVTGRDDELRLTGYLTAFADTSRHLSFAELLRQPNRFEPVMSPTPNLGNVAGREVAPVWLRFRVRNTTNQPIEMLAEVSFLCFDEISFHLADGSNRPLLSSAVLGWQTPVTQRLIAHRNFIFPFTLAAGVTQTAYFRVLKRRGAQMVPLRLRPRRAFETYLMTNYGFWGGVLGSLALVTVLSLGFYATTRDRIYWKYALCLLALLGFFFINAGFMNQFAFQAQFIPPDRNIYFVFPLTVFYTQLLFMRSFLPLRHTRHRVWHRVSTWLLLVGLICLGLLHLEWIVPLTEAQMRVVLIVFAAGYWLPLPVLGVFVGLNIAHRYQPRAAWLYLLALGPFYVLNWLQILGNFQLIPTLNVVENHNSFAVAALFEVVVLAFGLAYRYKATRDHADELLDDRARQQQRTYQAELANLELRNAMLLEKERIARDLHDNVGAQLSLAVSTLHHALRQSDVMDGSRPWIPTLKTVIGYTRDTVTLLRETIWAIQHENATVGELVERVHQYVDRYCSQLDDLNVHLDLQGPADQPLSAAKLLNMFRIVQEALHNIVKHAQATEITIRLTTQTDGQLHLTVSDNGQGLATDVLPAEGKHGLVNMKRRAEEVGGTFEVRADHGTLVEVYVPG